MPKQETPQELEVICKWLWQTSNVTLVIEEAEQYIGQYRPMLPYTSGLMRMGRNWGIGVWATTRRIQDISKRFFDLSQRVFFFRCGFKSREYIGDMIGQEYMYPSANPKVNKTGYSITTLPQYHCLHFDLENETAQIVTLKLRGELGRIQEVGKKSEVDRKSVEKLRDVAVEGAKEKEKEKTDGMV